MWTFQQRRTRDQPKMQTQTDKKSRTLSKEKTIGLTPSRSARESRVRSCAVVSVSGKAAFRHLLQSSGRLSKSSWPPPYFFDVPIRHGMIEGEKENAHIRQQRRTKHSGDSDMRSKEKNFQRGRTEMKSTNNRTYPKQERMRIARTRDEIIEDESITTCDHHDRNEPSAYLLLQRNTMSYPNTSTPLLFVKRAHLSYCTNQEG